MEKIDFNDFFFCKRAVLLFVLSALCWYWYSGMMLHHVWDSPFQYKGADPAYWLLSALGIPKLILSNAMVAKLFSVGLISTFVCALIFQRQRWVVVLAGMMLLLYQIIFNYKIGYHTHHLYGFQFALLPFYFRSELQLFSFGFARIMVCLTYFFAGFFKLIGKAWTEIDSFSNTLQNQLSAYFYFNPDAIRIKASEFLIHHSQMAWMFFLSAMLLQLSFALGLFTRRFDRFLAFFIVLFHTMDWFLMNLGVFMGMVVMAYLFLQNDGLYKKQN